MVKNKYPDCYLHIENCKSGEDHIMPMRGNSSLNLTHQVKKWIKKMWNSDCILDGDLTPKLQGEYYARIMTDGRPPESVVCWTGGGFNIKCLLS